MPPARPAKGAPPAAQSAATATAVGRRARLATLAVLGGIGGVWLWALLGRGRLDPSGADEPLLRMTVVDSAPVVSLDFSPDGGQLLLSAAGRGARRGSRGGVQLVLDAARPDSDLPNVRAGAFGRVPLRRVRTLRAFRGDLDRLGAARYAPGGALLFTASNPVTVWDARSGKVVRSLKAGNRAVAFLPDGRGLLWQSDNGDLLLQDAVTGAVRGALPPPPPAAPGVSSETAAPLRDLVVAGGGGDAAAAVLDADGRVTVYDLAGGRVRGALAVEGVVALAARRAGGPIFATAHPDGAVRLWDPAASLGGAVRTLRAPAPARSLAFSPDGARLAAGLADGRVSLFDVPSGGDVPAPRALSRPADRGEDAAVTALAFRPDGSALAAGNAGGQITLWSLTPKAGRRPGGRPSPQTAPLPAEAMPEP